MLSFTALNADQSALLLPPQRVAALTDNGRHRVMRLMCLCRLILWSIVGRQVVVAVKPALTSSHTVILNGSLGSCVGM